MKIVQTFWSGGREYDQVLKNAGGWLATEYHWQSWALSCLQLINYYEDVELITDEVGKRVLIDLFELPYTSVRVELDCLNAYPPDLWALAKIHSYGLQEGPFLHVDGDVYIWEPFNTKLLESQLIAQNVEINFPFYYEPLFFIQTHCQQIPNCIAKKKSQSEPLYACNAGVIGGNDIGLFKRYAYLARTLVDSNMELLTSGLPNHFNICLEQFLYYALAYDKGIPIQYLIDTYSNFDPTYPGLADFDEVPYNTKFIHAMHDYKRNQDVCWHLSYRLRQDHPEFYYLILSLCKKADIKLYSPVYELTNLCPIKNDFTHFLTLQDDYRVKQAKNSQPDEIDWSYQYAKSIVHYQQAQELFGQPTESILKQYISIDADCSFVEEKNSPLNQQIIMADIRTLSTISIPLHLLDMILIDSLEQGVNIGEAISEAATHLQSKDFEAHLSDFVSLALNRIKELFYRDVFEWRRS